MQDGRARLEDRLTGIIVRMGHPERFGRLICEGLRTTKAMERMIHYLIGVRPSSAEEIADEMLAIRSEIEAWREKKESEEASARYYAMRRRGPLGED